MDLDLFSKSEPEHKTTLLDTKEDSRQEEQSPYNKIKEGRDSINRCATEEEQPTAKKQDIAGNMKKYDPKEILEASTRYFNGDTLAATVWMNKYALKDSEGNIYELTPDDMHRRIA
ncbi:MAG: hypothetical protein K2K11_05195, partial [Bacteroidales bacterium]|nr:hypothetical protein [Bacteroidales bacterium]